MKLPLSITALLLFALASSPTAAKVPTEILEKIKAPIIQKYPDDFSMQKALIEDQKESYEFLQSFDPKSIKAELLTDVFAKIKSRYPSDYSMQKALIEDQVSNYLELNE